MSESINDGKIRSKYLTRDAIIHTVGELKTILDRNVKEAEVSGLISYMKELNYNLFRDTDPNVVTHVIAERFANMLQKHSDGGYDIDTHELLKRNIGRLTISDSTDDGTVYNRRGCASQSYTNQNNVIPHDPDNKNNPINNINGYEGLVAAKNIERSLSNIHSEFKIMRTIQDVYSAYVLLDSRYRKIEGSITNQINEYRWEYTPTIITTQGTTNSIAWIQDIMYFQLHDFSIPYVSDADNIYKRVSFLIQEFSALAVIAHENRRYHLMLPSTVEGNRINLQAPVVDSGTFRFSTPINKVDQLTISFGSPLTGIVFPPDRYGVNIIPINATETQIVFSVDHNVNTGERVILSGYTTMDTQNDNVIIADINRNSGHVTQVVNANTLSIAVDLTTITPLTTNPTVECYITSRRILIPLRFVYAHKPTL